MLEPVKIILTKLLTGYYDEYVVNNFTDVTKPRGGRGHKAPYETTHLRVPKPLKPALEDVVDRYCELVIAGSLSPEDQIENLNQLIDTSVPITLTEAVQRAKDIMKQKRSARESLAKLLTALYDYEVKPEDLKN